MLVPLLYLDAAGIDSLYAQLQEQTPVESTKKAEAADKKAGKLKPKLALGNILARLGLASFDLEAELESGREKKSATETKYAIQTENKLAAVIKHLHAAHLLTTDINRALEIANEENCAVFSRFSGTFDVYGFISPSLSRYWLEYVNRTGMLTFQLHNLTSVQMGMSLEKTRMGNPMAPGEHFIFITDHGEGTIRLNVFGLVYKSYIKPFAADWITQIGPTISAVA